MLALLFLHIFEEFAIIESILGKVGVIVDFKSICEN